LLPEAAEVGVENQSKAQVPAHQKRIFLKNFYSFSRNELRESGIENQEPFSHQSRIFALLKEGCILNIMKGSKSFLSCLERSRKIGRIILKVGRTPNKVGQFYCQVVETKTWRTNHVWSTSFVENTSRPNSPRNQRNQRQKICVNLCESVSNFSLCLGALVAETQLVRRSLGEGVSIKNNKLCETNPIFQKVKYL
jgi:hypothetical protein